MADLINRDHAAQAIEAYLCSQCDYDTERDPECIACPYLNGHEILKSVPTIEPEVRHGRWIEETEPDENGNVVTMCNQCYHTDEHGVNMKITYCWYCGARMDGGADNG